MAFKITRQQINLIAVSMDNYKDFRSFTQQHINMLPTHSTKYVPIITEKTWEAIVKQLILVGEMDVAFDRNVQMTAVIAQMPKCIKPELAKAIWTYL